MKFDDLDERMREFEGIGDEPIPTDGHLVARLDGRGFTKLTKGERLDLEKPFDPQFRDVMVATTRHLMHSGLAVVYAYTESDEISLWFAPDEHSFGRKPRKLLSVLAGEASGCFSLAMGVAVAFDCRLALLPDVARVCDYFRWRQQDSIRNAMIGHVYWRLRGEGLSRRRATSAMSGLGHAALGDRLRGFGVEFDELPAWQRKGVGQRWIRVQHEGEDPRTGETIATERRKILVDDDLPTGEAYAAYLAACIGAEADTIEECEIDDPR
jgi:tRNA(His) guanylyltransferase